MELNANQFCALQDPVKEWYRSDPDAARITLRDRLLEALVGCFGVIRRWNAAMD